MLNPERGKLYYVARIHVFKTKYFTKSVFLELNFNSDAIFNTTINAVSFKYQELCFYILNLSIILFILIYTNVSVTLPSMYTTNLQECKMYVRTNRNIFR